MSRRDPFRTLDDPEPEPKPVAPEPPPPATPEPEPDRPRGYWGLMIERPNLWRRFCAWLFLGIRWHRI